MVLKSVLGEDPNKIAHCFGPREMTELGEAQSQQVF